MPDKVYVWTDSAPAKAYLTIPDPSTVQGLKDFAWHQGTPINPAGWETVGFDDSGWTDALAIGDVNGWYGIAPAPINTPAGMLGLWPFDRNGGPDTYEAAIFRQWITVPPANQILGLTPYPFVAPNYKAWLVGSTFQVPAPTHYQDLTGSLYVNGERWTDETNTVGSLVPGTPALFAWELAIPLGEGIYAFPDFANQTRAVYTFWAGSQSGYAGQPWNAWVFEFTTSTALLPGTATSGRAAVSLGGGAPIPPVFQGPLEVALATAWEGGLDSWGANDGTASFPKTGDKVREEHALFSGLIVQGQVAQGFTARWPSVQQVRVMVRATNAQLQSAWPPANVFECYLYADSGGGVPGQVLAVDTIQTDTLPPLNPFNVAPQPLYFDFVIPVQLVPDATYWVVFGLNQSPAPYTVTVGYEFWTCPAPPGPLLSQVTYGHAEQAARALYRTTLTSIWQLRLGTTTGAGYPLCAELPANTPVPAVWDMAIDAGAGLAVFDTGGVWTSPDTGQGLGGQGDPNVSAYPVAYPASGWAGTISQINPRPGYIDWLGAMHMWVELGRPWVLAYGPTTQAPPFGWGPRPAVKTEDDGDWPWTGGYDATVACRRPNGSFFAAYDAGNVPVQIGSATGLVNYPLHRIGAQFLSGSNFLTDTFSDGPILGLNENYTFVNVACLADSTDLVHWFFTRQSPPVWNTLTSQYIAQPIQTGHATVDANGTLGSISWWDVGITLGYPVAHPGGGIAVPFWQSTTAGHCLNVAVWTPSATALVPTFEELPSQPRVDFLSAEVMSLCYVGNRGYLFREMGGQIDVATIDLGFGAWSDLVPWISHPPGMVAQFISSNYIQGRGVIGVYFRLDGDAQGSVSWYQEFADPSGGYPSRALTKCHQSLLTTHGKSIGMVVG